MHEFRTRAVTLACAAAFGAVLAAGAAAAEWPQFRGPRRDGVSTETGLLAAWPAGGPKVVWRTALGGGYSSLAVAAGRIFTMLSVGDDEFVASFDTATGAERWRVRVDSPWKDRFGDGPRATPTVDGKVVFTLSSRGKLHALGAEDGAVVWTHDLPREYGAEAPQWGYAGSPLVEGGLLLVDVGGKEGSGIVAFDKASGREVWRSRDDRAGYSAPVAFDVGGVRHAVFFTANTVTALRPKDGGLLWSVPWKTSWDVNAATPLFIAPDRLFVSSGYDHGGAVYKIVAGEGGSAVEEVWANREMKNRFSSSVLHGGHLYGFDEKTLKCIDAGSGETRWQARGLGHGSLIAADGRLIVLGDEGTLVLVEATAEEYREKSRAQVFAGKTWTAPALSDGTLYLRDEKELVALDVSE
jgi:outer membrane protein assembly factor BamB